MYTSVIKIVRRKNVHYIDLKYFLCIPEAVIGSNIKQAALTRNKERKQAVLTRNKGREESAHPENKGGNKKH